MQKLVKCRIVLNAAQQRVTIDTALRKHGYVPVWIWKENIPTAYLLVSVNDDLYSSGDLNTDVYNFIIEACPEVEQLSCVLRDAELLDVAFNGPSSIIRTVNGNNTTVTQTTVINDDVGTWTYIFNITFDSSGSVISTSNSSSYVDPHTQSSTTVTTDPVTGETTQSTTTSTDGGYGNGGSTTTSTTTYDENGNLAGSSSQTQNSDGTSSSSEQTYNENGTIAYNHDEFHNTDGSSESHTTNYDENGDPTDGNTQWVDTSQNQNTQTYEYNENGEQYISGYEIDTSNNQSGGESITGGLDTGVLAFDGRDFEIYIKCRLNPSTWNTTHLNPIVNASERINGKVNGVTLFSTCSTGAGTRYNLDTYQVYAFTGNKYHIMFNKYFNNAVNGGGGYITEKNYTTSNYSEAARGAFSASSTSSILILKIKSINNKFYCYTYQTESDANNDNYKTKGVRLYSKHYYDYHDFGNYEFSGITVEIGHWETLTDGNYYADVEVLDFYVHKL